MAQPPRRRKKPANSKSKPTKAASTRKSAGAKSKGSKQSSQTKRRFRSLLLKIGLIGLLLVSVGIIYLDAKITTHFEGKRWAIPAKVYARPLELYDGVQLSEAQLRFELNLLNYRRVYKDKQDPGTYRFQGDNFQISTRGFDSWEGPEPARHLSLTLGQGRLQDLTNDGKPITMARLEPVMIGGIYPADNQDRVLVKLNQVPPLLVKGLIAVEDRTFYHNIGISFRGIARALWVDITTGSLREGGSTLTQQLVKNFYLSSKRTLSRKVTEAVMAVLLECHYSKNEILQAYLNEVYLGQAGKRGIYGFGLGSLFYFGQPVWELKTSQIALLVGLVRGPSWYDPRRNPERALARRNDVLKEMLGQGVLDQAEYEKAVRKPLGIIDKPQYEESRYPAFMDLVKRQLRRDYKDADLRSEGLRVFTTLDPWAQHQLEQAIEHQTDLLQKRYGKPLTNLEAAGVITSSNTGEVVAVVGGRSYRFEGFNRALDANRQIGSLAKPAVYLAALEHGYTLASLVHDEPLQVHLPNGTLWSPQNFERKSHGDVPAIVALANSYNQATARLAMDVGLGNVVDVMHRLGITEDIPEVPSIALGSVSLSPFEVAQMYQTIASEGFNTPLRSVRSVLTSDGQQL